ncbi:MAG: PEP-CTERM sorting domain-containing protein [Colwellia sp.]|nr:PEP-CTERM sorting domain-containing protein [Colwellia sp.]
MIYVYVYVQLEITKTTPSYFKECIAKEFNMNLKMLKAAAAGLVLSVSGFANAGLIYTNQAAFDAATLGLTSAWTEDFESFLLGPSADPLGIGGGQAEMVDGGNSSIINVAPTGLAWLQPGQSNSNAIIRGLGNTSLGLNALSFNFGNEVIQTIDFIHTLGTDTSPSYGANGGQTNSFVGWIGSGNELLNLTQFVQTQGITVDNIRAYTATSVPEPSTLAIFALGIMGLASRRFKKQ